VAMLLTSVISPTAEFLGLLVIGVVY